MDATIVESGLRLFERLMRRPNVDNICPAVFPDRGLQVKQMVEIGGPSSRGEAVFMCQVLAQLILPSTYKGIDLPGRNATVLFVNWGNKLTWLNLTSYLEKKVSEYIKDSCSIKEIVDHCCMNMLIVNSTSEHEFISLLKQVDEIVARNHRIGAVIIDSLSYFWPMNSACFQRLNPIAQLKMRLTDMNVIIFYTSCYPHLNNLSEIDYVITVSPTREHEYKLSCRSRCSKKEVVFDELFTF